MNNPRVKGMEFDPESIQRSEYLDDEVKAALFEGKARFYSPVFSGQEFILINGGKAA